MTTRDKGSMETYIRGSMIFFTAAIVDRKGTPVSPDSASLTLVYRDLERAQKRDIVSMVVNSNVAEVSWDSSVAMPGPVLWSVKASGANAIVQDGSLTLTANEANQ